MKFTINDFRKRFPNDDSCLDEIMGLTHGEDITCPECEKTSKFHRVRNRRCYECRWCGYQVYPTKGTVFEKTTTPLSDWFYVIYLMTETRSGVSAKEVERQLGVTYKTAWRMCHKVRELMGQNEGRKLTGQLEADETLVGGKKSGGKRGRGAPGKTVVFGVMERGGDVKAVPVPNVKKKTLQPIIHENAEKGSVVNTDELKSYIGLDKAGFEHRTVNHGSGQYVDGDIHVNSMEGFWARLKLSIRGTHVHVSRKHMHRYVDEFAFRYNNRKNPTPMFEVALQGLRRA